MSDKERACLIIADRTHRSRQSMGGVIVGAAGLAGSYLYGKHKEAEENAYQQGYQQGSGANSI